MRTTTFGWAVIPLCFHNTTPCIKSQSNKEMFKMKSGAISGTFTLLLHFYYFIVQFKYLSHSLTGIFIMLSSTVKLKSDSFLLFPIIVAIAEE